MNVGSSSERVREYVSDNWKEITLLQVIHEIRQIITTCIDNSGATVVLEELPVDFKTLRDIRSMTSVLRIDRETITVVATGVQELEQFIQDMNKYFLPNMKEYLRVSFLKPDRLVGDKDLYIIRRFAVYAFPHNLARLSELTYELKTILELLY